MRRRSAACAGLAAMAAAAIALAQVPGEQLRDSARDAIDFEQKPLDEAPVSLPGAPKMDALIAFDPGRRTSMRYFVDPASVAVVHEGIVRFTLVVRGDGAAANVSYEAIRCKTYERKVYAYGRSDGTWQPVRNPAWTRIGGQDADGHRHVLYESFFCPSRQIIASAREGVEALGRGGHPRAADLLTTTPIPR
jgi:hypothetical protein